MEALCSSLLACDDSTIPWADLQAALRSCHKVDEATDLTSAPPVTAPATATLQNCELWREFHDITNEMIVTKAGRRMFPLPKVKLSCLEPTAEYCVLLEFQPMHSFRWRFLNGRWQQGGTAVAEGVSSGDSRHGGQCVYLHPSSPATGRHWMDEFVTFTKLKLSNKENGNGKIKLNSLHKYQPCLHIVRLPLSKLGEGGAGPHPSRTVGHPHITSHPFPETQFIAVTAYQNEKITQMKIKHNPFAKAFLGSPDRDDLTSSCDDNTTGTQPRQQRCSPAGSVLSAAHVSIRVPVSTPRPQPMHSTCGPSTSLPASLPCSMPILTIPARTYGHGEAGPFQQQVPTAHASTYVPVYQSSLSHHPSYAYPQHYTTTAAPTPLSHYSPDAAVLQPTYWSYTPAHPTTIVTTPTYYHPHPTASYVTPLGYHN